MIPATGEKTPDADRQCRNRGRAIDDARIWDAPAAERAAVLRRAADLYEENHARIFGILGREAGKTLGDAVAELRERGVRLFRENRGDYASDSAAYKAIAPWNFPLAIFTGQIAAALMAGNAVIAKPAEPTPVIAMLGVQLLHQAGVPKTALQLLPGRGSVVGTAMTSDPRVAGVVFTGSTETAQTIARTMAANLEPGTPLIAETGGLNAMVVDSTALPEQAVRDVVASSFRSAGQRCSALRCLYVQEDIAPHLIEMIKGAMDELTVGDPWALSTDVGPVIDPKAQKDIAGYIEANDNRVLHKLDVPDQGYFIPPTLLKVGGIADLERETFGPVLHVATFRGDDLDQVVADINARGFGLTFGLHTRIDSRVQEVSDAIHVGNIYVNRNQIGAVVGSQPFGGEGLSGTGPKAGGPRYVPRFFAPGAPAAIGMAWKAPADEARLRSALSAAAVPKRIEERLMPGPTGELNRLSAHARGPVLCLGPGRAAAAAQVTAVERLGGIAVAADGDVAPALLTRLPQLSAVLWWGDEARGRAYAAALADRDGEIVQLITAMPDLAHVAHERHLCVDTTAAGGNAALLAG
ncbi:L-glutamate gamma-semialdehyde dehydrogenase [Paracoccus mutanolyticus]